LRYPVVKIRQSRSGSLVRGSGERSSPASLAGVLLHPSAGRAQIVVDGTMTALPGTCPSLSSLADRRSTSGESRQDAGNNLFHSFQKFNLQNGGDGEVLRTDYHPEIISRVTGGEKSTIDGKIQSTITGASLYFSIRRRRVRTDRHPGRLRLVPREHRQFSWVPGQPGVPDKMQFPATLEVPS